MPPASPTPEYTKAVVSREAVCRERKGCTLTKLTPAGKSGAQKTLYVAEVHFDLENRIEIAREAGCRIGGKKVDGGVEYWTIEQDQSPRLLARMCNDGYGKAGAGADELTVGNNLVIHKRTGGSSAKWEMERTVQLSPPRAIAFRKAASVDGAAQGQVADSDVATLTTKVNWCNDATIPAFAVPISRLAAEPGNESLGDCAMRFGAKEQTGADARRYPEMRLLALNQSRVLVQVYDPVAPRAANSVRSSYVDVWTGTPHATDGSGRAASIGMDGVVYSVSGGALPPAVRTAEVQDERGHKAILFDVQYSDPREFDRGLAVVYVRAAGPRRVPMLSTAPMGKNTPVYLPVPVSFPVNCAPRNGFWTVVSSDGTLD